MTDPNPVLPSPNLLVRLLQTPRKVAPVILAVAVACFAGSFYLQWKIGTYPDQVAVTALLGLAFGVVGGWLYLQEQVTTGMSAEDHAQLVVLLLGGFLGLALTVESICWGVRWWEVIAGGKEAWRGPNRWQLWVVIALELGGLGLIFLSLLGARGKERDNPTMRRLLYGYVAVLTGLLLFEIFLILNIFVQVYYPKANDWTTDRIYTLDDQSQRILSNLEKPVRVVHIMATRQDDRYEEINGLLENSRNTTKKFNYDEVLRHSQLKTMSELRQKYFVEEEGLLVIYGEGREETFQFVRMDELYDRGGAGRERPSFKGEDALMSAIGFLSEGKVKPIVYFTQGHGELDVGGPAMGGAAGGAEARGGEIVRRLSALSLEVKGLEFGAKALAEGGRVVHSDKVPEDAAAVVIAGPQRPLSPEAVAALRTYYMTPNAQGKKGSLIILAGVVPDAQGQMVATGLEGLLAEQGVELTNTRVLTGSPIGRNAPLNVVMTHPADAAVQKQNPIAMQFLDGGQRLPLVLVDARVVRPQPSAMGGATQVEPLLTVSPRFMVWPEESLREDPMKVLDRLAKAKTIQAKLSREALPVALLVTEGRGAMPPGDPHAGMDLGGNKPRMVVFGNSHFISDGGLQELASVNENSAGVLAGSVAWLRERANSLKIPARNRREYQMSPEAPITAMFVYPTGLMTLGIIGLGLGIWVVRRK